MAVIGGHCCKVFGIAFIIAVIISPVFAELKVGQLSVPEIEDALQVGVFRSAIEDSHADMIQQCPLVQELNFHKKDTAPHVPGYASQVFGTLFPGIAVGGIPGPAVNALLATLYISGPPSQCRDLLSFAIN